MKLLNHSKNLFIITWILFFWVTCIYATDIRFAVISDNRYKFNSLEKTLKYIDSQNVDFLIVAGDFDPIENNYLDHFSLHGYTVGPGHTANSHGIYFVLGNHDSPPAGEAFYQNSIAPYYPKNGPNSAPEGTIYSFDRGDCHFVVTNQYWNYNKGGYTEQQLTWIEQDLVSNQKPFIFVIGHEPAFPQFNHIGDSLDADPLMRDNFWQILVNNNVTAFICGHTHYASAIIIDGVFQLDAGAARGSSPGIIIIDIGPTDGTAHLYNPNGSIPTGNVGFEIIARQYTINNDKNNNWTGCFISIL